MDTVVKEKFEILSAGLRTILQEKSALKEEIRYYQAENRELKTALNQAKGTPKNFEKRSENDNIAGQNGNYAKKVAAIAKQIDVYVEEIDRCIAQLGE